MKVFIEKNI